MDNHANGMISKDASATGLEKENGKFRVANDASVRFKWKEEIHSQQE